MTSLQLLWSAATASQPAELMLPALRSHLQIPLKQRTGLPAGLVPVASSQHILGDSAILHAADMTTPVQKPLGKQGKHAWYSHLSQNVLVWNMVLPGDAQKKVEGIESAFLMGLQSPCFTAKEQHAEHTGLIHLHPGVDGQHGVFQTLFAR